MLKDKYIEERFSRYFKFGQSEEEKIDIASTHNDTVATVSKEHAANLIEDRNSLLNFTIKLAKALNETNPDRFKHIFYEDGD